MSKSPSLRRIQADIRELSLDPSDRYHAMPLENDMFEWHFTIKGADGTDFAGGLYHGRILLPPDYPFKPPHIVFLTPSGRFEINTKVCLSFSAFHPELWQPAWGIRLILEALISFLPTPADGAIGSLDWSSKERQRLAVKSLKWTCPHCGPIVNLIPKINKEKNQEQQQDDNQDASKTRFQKEIESLKLLQQREHAKQPSDQTEEAAASTTAEEPSTTSTGEENDDEKKYPATTTDAAPAATATATTTTLETPQPQQPNRTEEGGSVENTNDMPTSPAAVAPATQEQQQQQEESNNQEMAATKTAAAIEPVVSPGDAQERDATVAETNQATNHINNTNGDDNLDGIMMMGPQDDTTAVNNNNNNNHVLTSWWIDPVLHASIVILSILCFLLLRKIQAILVDIRALHEQIEATSK